MSDGPKLYTNKPKKAQLKHHQQQHQASSPTPSSSASMSSSTPPGAASAPPPPQPPKESFARRYRFMIPLLLAVNFAVGVYFFMRTIKNDVEDEGEVPNAPSTPVSTPTPASASVTEKPSTPSLIDEPPKPREPIPENQQRELFKWMLEEKRKLKPKDSEEKKRIDDEKALLKQFIRAKSVPSL